MWTSPGASSWCFAPGSCTATNAAPGMSRVRLPWSIGAIRACEAFAPPPDSVDLEIHLTKMGQRLFYPPNVAGWPGGLAWLRGSTVLARANFAAWLTGPASGLSPDHFRAVAGRRGLERPEAWLDALRVLFSGEEVSADRLAEVRSAANLQSHPERAHAQIFNRMLSLPETQVG